MSPECEARQTHIGCHPATGAHFEVSRTAQVVPAYPTTMNTPNATPRLMQLEAVLEPQQLAHLGHTLSSGRQSRDGSLARPAMRSSSTTSMKRLVPVKRMIRSDTDVKA